MQELNYDVDSIVDPDGVIILNVNFKKIFKSYERIC